MGSNPIFNTHNNATTTTTIHIVFCDDDDEGFNRNRLMIVLIKFYFSKTLSSMLFASLGHTSRKRTQNYTVSSTSPDGVGAFFCSPRCSGRIL